MTGALGKRIPRWVIWVISTAVVFALTVWLFATLVAWFVRKGVEQLERQILGVDVSLGKLRWGFFSGRLYAHDLVLHNPDGQGYTSPYLLKAKIVHLDLNMVAFVLAWGQELHFEHMEFLDVEVNYENHGLHGSNVGEVRAYVKERRRRLCGGDGRRRGIWKSESGKFYLNGRRFVVHQVDVKSCCVKFSASAFQHAALHVDTADLHYDDLAADLGETEWEDVVKVLWVVFVRASLRMWISKQNLAHENGTLQAA
jgi:hypothetical protein